jgi:hypothetical protein
MVEGILEDPALSWGEAGLLREVALEEPSGAVLHGSRAEGVGA